jgi:hypothetical protein
MTEDELFNLIAYGGPNDPGTVKAIATAKISRAMMQRVAARQAAIGLDIDRAVLDRQGD